MEINAAGATSHRLYEDFEPFCKWLTDEGHETLEIDLKGFKKEHLKVQTNNKGIVTIYGERPMDATSHKWSRFHKEIKLSKECTMNDISAKFSHGILSIVMPKMVQPSIKADEKEKTEEAGLEATHNAMEKHTILGVKTRKRRAIEVAVGVIAVVAMVVAFWTNVATLVNRYKGVGKVDDV